MITSLDDPRLTPFIDVTKPDKRESPTRFVVEGENVVLRLLASPYACESIVCAQRKAERIRRLMPGDIPLLVLKEEVVADLVGFKFHSGVMAMGVRRPLLTAAELLTVPLPTFQRKSVILVLPEMNDPANLGTILRTAAALGVRGVLLGERCRDPFIRHTIRTSMGAIFNLPLAKSQNLLADLATLRDGYDVQTWASVLADDAVPLGRLQLTQSTALLLGSEGPGLPDELTAACTGRVTIPMHRGTDSLNVAAAAAVLLYRFCA